MKKLLFLLLMLRVAHGQTVITIPVTNKFVPLPDSGSVYATPTALAAAVAGNITSITVDYPIVAVSPTEIKFSSTWTDSINTALGYGKLASPAFTGTPTAPTAAIGTNSTQLATTAFVTGYADANADAMLAAMGSTIVAYPLGSPYPSNANQSNLTANQINGTAVWLKTAQTVTGVKFDLITAFVGTASGNNQVFLYSQSAGTMTLVASSTTSTTMLTGSTGITNVPFTSSYSAVPGLYYVAITYNESALTTAPKLADVCSLGAANLLDFTNNNRLTWFLAANNTGPSTEALSATGNGGSQFWLTLTK